MKRIEPQIYALFSAMVEDLIGLRYDEISQPLLVEKLEVAASDAGFDSLLDYYYYLRYDAAGTTATQTLIEHLVVPETYFFRELAALEWLARDVLLPKVKAGLRPRVWSAACSTGEEPLTLAMLLDEKDALSSVDIVATDVSARGLARARSGKFRTRSLRDGAIDRLVHRYLRRTSDGITIEPRLIEQVSWRRLNLLDSAAFGALGLFDAILCRNVLIYFSSEGIVRVVRSLLDRLTGEGVLLVGVSESLFWISADIICEEKSGVFSYRRGSRNVSRARVLVIDDSAYARKVIRDMLEASGRFEVVGIARDGLEALESISELHPDVITLDLVMPELDGIGVLDALGDRCPPAVVVSISGADSQLGAAALMKGAVDIVLKPSAIATERLYEMRDELVAKLLAAASARPRREHPVSQSVLQASPTSAFRLVAVGASTGGPRAISAVISSLPAELPVPVVVALHIPEGYTKPLADRLAEGSRLRVTEGRDGAVLDAGTVVIVPGGQQSKVIGSKDRLRLAVSKSREPNRYFAPSIDLLFESAARAASPVLGVVLTGMGNDGTIGAKAIRTGGGWMITEAEETCVVYGMPRSVHESGESDRSVRLEKIAECLIERLGKQ